MPVAQLQDERRNDAAPVFSSDMFYRFSNHNLPKYTLSAGIFQDSQGGINMTDTGSLSSENWQLFYQSGRYFIRNYDYGAKYQLGLTESSRSTPKLYPRSGKVEQQWSIQGVNGGYELVNGLWGNGTTFNLSKDWWMPGMGSGNGGAIWTISSNPSAANSRPLGGGWVSNVEAFEVLAPSPSPSSSLSASTSAAATSARASSSLPSSTNVTTTNTITTPSPSLSSGAIAGIAIGTSAFISSLALAIWFFVVTRKRRSASSRKNPYLVHSQLHGVPHLVASEKHAYTTN